MIDELDGDSCIATLIRALRAVGGRRVSPWADYSRLARARARARDQEIRTRRAPLRDVRTRRLPYTAVQQQQSATL